MGPISLVMGGVGAILLIGGVGWSVSRPAPPAAAELPASAVISPPVVPLAPIPGVEEIEEVVDPAPAQASALPPVPAAAVTEPEPELPSVVPDGAFPAGQWSGSFAGFNAEMQLSGEPAALDGDVTVAFAGGQPVRSRVTGTYDLDSGILTLDDVEDSPDAGTYSGKVDAERGRVSGTFESRGSNKTVVPFFFRRID
jgi:hypothetical protein